MITGRLATLSARERARILLRGECARDSDGGIGGGVGRADTRGVADAVSEIITDVRMRGDDALRDMARRFDNAELTSLEIPRAAWDDALHAMDPGVRSALEDAARAIRAFHQAQMPADFEIDTRPGVRLGRRVEPLTAVGVYAPGGRAAYPSSILMGVVPARVAGVGDIIVCTPPGSDGSPSAVVLAACAIAGADRVFAIGGAGAIAALAYGTASVPAVARVVGPGNAYVAEAKRQVNGVVSIDSPAGPSEVLVIADASADAQLIASEMIAQAEHDPDAAAVALIVADDDFAARVRLSVEQMTSTQARADIIRASLASNGAILRADSLEEAIAFSNEYAPEHLSLMVADPRAALARARCAGTVFLGSAASVAFGDYMTGANHVLPTNRLARSFSGLSTLDFVRFVTYQEITVDGARAMSAATSALAMSEGLPAHALAADLRGSNGNIADNGSTATQATPTARSEPRLRAGYRDIELYEPGRKPCAVDLSDNTNLHGMPPAARAVLTGAASPLVTRYPTVYSRVLKESLARLHDIAYENVVTGCGSDDILDSLMRAFCEAGDSVAFPAPTFGVVDLFARMNNVVPRGIPHVTTRNELALDVNALVSARAAVTYICNPNNPTGTQYSRASIEELADRVDGILVIDEAYADYSGVSCIDLALSHSRVIVVRTLSKAYGLAGLRIGYAIGNARLIREVEKSRGPYKVGGLAEAAAVAAVTHDRAWVASHVDEVRRNRAKLTSDLNRLGLSPLASASNFLLVPLHAGQQATEWTASLRQSGVAVRPFPALPSVGEAIRVTVGPWPLMERFVNAIGTVARTGTGK